EKPTSNPTRGRVPDVFMKLKLEAHVEARFQQPIREIHGRDGAKYTADQDDETPVEPVLADRGGRPVKIRAGGDHEFDLIGGLQDLQVGPAVVGAFAAVGALEVHDDVGPAIDAGHIMSAAGFEENG